MEYGNAHSCPRINTGFSPPFNTLLGKQCICQSWWKYQGHDTQSAALITGQGHLAGHILSSFLPGGSGIPKAISRKLARGSLVIPTGRTLIFQKTTLRAGNLSNLPQTQDNRPMLSAWDVSSPAGIYLHGDVRYRSMGSHHIWLVYRSTVGSSVPTGVCAYIGFLIPNPGAAFALKPLQLCLFCSCFFFF